MDPKNKQNTITPLTGKETKDKLVEMIKDKDEYIRQLEEKTSTPESEAAKAKQLDAIRATAEAIQKGVFSEEVKAYYEKLMIAIDAKEARIEELYGVESALAHIAAVNAAKEKTEADNKAELAELKTQYQEKTKAIKEEYSALEDSLRKSYEEKKRIFEEKQEREEAETIYNQDKKLRERIDNAKFETDSEIRKIEVRIAEKQAELDSVVKRLHENGDAYDRLVNIDGEIEEAKAVAFEAGRKDVETKAVFEKRAIESRASHDVELLEKDLKSAEEKNASLTVENNKLSQKLDGAYETIRNMANASVNASRPVLTGTTDTSGKK